jgi:hypothetical protein
MSKDITYYAIHRLVLNCGVPEEEAQLEGKDTGHAAYSFTSMGP